MRKLKWKDIDFQTGYMTFMGTKNGDHRIILMLSQLKAFMLSFFQKQLQKKREEATKMHDKVDNEENGLTPSDKANSQTDIKNDYLFINKEGKVRNPDQINYYIHLFQKNYPDQKQWRCHDLRHSFAYNFLKSGGQMYELKAILGHKSISMTVDYYGHFKASDMKRVTPYDF